MSALAKIIRLPLLQKPALQPAGGSKRHVVFTIMFYLLIGSAFAFSFLFFRSNIQELSHISISYESKCEPLQRRVDSNGGTEPSTYTFVDRKYEIGDRQMLEMLIQNKPDEFMSKLECTCSRKTVNDVNLSNYVPDPLEYFNFIHGYICKSDYQKDSIERVYIEVNKRLVDEPHFANCNLKDGTPEQVHDAFSFHHNSTIAGFNAIRDKVIEANGPYLCNTTLQRSVFESISLSFSVMSLAISVFGFIIRQLNAPKKTSGKDSSDGCNDKSTTNEQNNVSVSMPNMPSVSIPNMSSVSIPNMSSVQGSNPPTPPFSSYAYGDNLV